MIYQFISEPDWHYLQITHYFIQQRRILDEQFSYSKTRPSNGLPNYTFPSTPAKQFPSYLINIKRLKIISPKYLTIGSVFNMDF